MIAKLIVWDQDRTAALARLKSALLDYQVVGLKTNLAFLTQLATHQAFKQADLDTHFIERFHQDLFPAATPLDETVLSVAALHVMLEQQAAGEQTTADQADPFSPWDTTSGWRLNEDNHHHVTFIDSRNQQEYSVTIHFRESGFLIELPAGEYSVSGQREGVVLKVNCNGQQFVAKVIAENNQLTVFIDGQEYPLHIKQEGHSDDDNAASSNLTAPMPGTIIALMVDSGAQVETGQPLLVMEAMKMEHTIKAPANGVVTELLYQVGDLVDEGVELLSFEADS